MSKKKKKGLNKSNPHKLGENELVDQIHFFLNQNQVNQAYKLVKVLLEKGSSAKNSQLFKNVLSRKLKLLEEKGQGEDIASLLTEAKKRFSIDVFFDADEFNKLRQLSDKELVDHFLNRESIPDYFRYRIADYLYFSEKKEKEFINRHREFKDVFFVKEAFKNGFQPETTKKLMSGIDINSPYKHWLLLRKGIEAFYDNDNATLELLKKKITEPSFPKFLIEKLLQVQELLDGRNGNFNQLAQSDIKFFEALCGETFLEHCLLSHLEKISGGQNKQSALPLLNSWSGIISTETYIDLFVLTLGKVIRSLEYPDQKEQLIVKLKRLPPIRTFYLDIMHLLAKFMGHSFLIETGNGSIFESIATSKTLANCEIFPPKVLKAELLYASAQSEAKQSRLSGNPFGLFDIDSLYHDEDDGREEIINLLEESISSSPHNPEIFIELIKEYNAVSMKTSVINTAIKKMLASFPTNPEGYKLAGDIAYKNRTYSKALSFYEKAHDLMPLNRDFSLVIIKCYGDIIDKRNSQNSHLIESDLQKAKSFTLNSGKKVLTEFNLLRTRAIVKLINFNSMSWDSFVEEIDELSGHFQESNLDAFRFLFLIEDGESSAQIKTSFLERMRKDLFDHCATKTFSEILSFCLGKPSQLKKESTVFSSLVIGFFQKEKKNPTATVDDITTWMLVSLENNWNRLFTALVYLGESIFPNHPVYKFFIEIIQNTARRSLWKKHLLKKETINWFKTDTGINILELLCPHDYLFEVLYDVIEDGRDVAKTEELLDEVKDMLQSYYSPPNISSFEYFIESVNHMDYTPYQSIREIFGHDAKNRNRREDPLKNSQTHTKMATQPKKKKTDYQEPDEQLDIFGLLDN
ncbi:hypothetical protein KKA14_15840 [bacterium]|nr:hypothetical protein [bacterium]